MKEPVVEDPTHKKLSATFVYNLKLQKMQYASPYYDLKNVKDENENTNSKQKDLFNERLPALTMLNMNKKLKEESKIKDHSTGGKGRQISGEATVIGS